MLFNDFVNGMKRKFALMIQGAMNTSGKTDKKTVRVAVIGCGNMGRQHVGFLGGMDGVEIAGVCDIDSNRADAAAAAGGCKAWTDATAMLDEATPDAVMIATPHYDHVPLAKEAFARGIHALVEKPVGVEGKVVREAIEAHEKAQTAHPGLLFAAMFNQRTYGHWLKIKDLIDSGELGRIVRATWIITDWFRTQHYFDTGSWRATWAGEGGGVLLNQCPHNLDMYQWFFGMPKHVRGFASLGKYHDIEVEDEVTAYFEHENGMVGHFITSTGESPGTNRLEIVGERGRLVFENGKLDLMRNRESMLDLIQHSKKSFTHVESWPTSVPFSHHGEGGHRILTERFVAAIRGEGTLVAEGAEGLHSVLLANAIMLSSFEQRSVDIPLDDEVFSAKLADLRKGSRYPGGKPEATSDSVEDLEGTY